MARTKKRAVFVDTEVAFDTDPSADGSGYAWVPAVEIGQLRRGKTPMRTNYFTKRNFETPPTDDGAQSWEIDITTPLIGLSSAAGDGVAPPADDWLDAFLLHILGTQASLTGEGLASSASSTSIALDTSAAGFVDQQLIAVYESGLPSPERTQFTVITDDSAAPTYTVAPAFEDYGTTPVTGGAIAYGGKYYQPDDDGGSTLALVYCEDDLEYTLTGGRCTRFTISSTQGEMVKASMSIRGRTSSVTTKASLPSAASGPATSPIVGLASPFIFNGTIYTTPSVEFDFGITTAEVPAQEAQEGVSGDESIMVKPVCTVTPLRTSAIDDLRDNATQGRMVVQFGAGVLSGGALNSFAIEAQIASAMTSDHNDENGRLRQSVQFECFDNVEFAAGVAARFLQVMRV